MLGCQGVDVGASLIEVTPHLINVGPFGSELSIDLPGAISVEDVGIEVRAATPYTSSARVTSEIHALHVTRCNLEKGCELPCSLDLQPQSPVR